MKKIIMMVIFILFFNAVLFAQAAKLENRQKHKYEVVKGRVISVNSSKNEVTIRDAKNKVRTVVVNPDKINYLKQNVILKFVLYSGSNKAVMVKGLSKYKNKK